MHEDIPILNFLVPKEFTHDNGKLTGVRVREGEGRVRRQGPPQPGADRRAGPALPCDDVLVAVGQENSFPWIERDVGIEFDKWDMPKVDTTTMASTNPKVFFGGDAAFGPKNIIWAVAHGHDAALSIHKMLLRRGHHRAAAPRRADLSQKMGIHEWSYDNDISLDKRFKVPQRDKVIALKDIRAEVELGFDVKLALGEAQRCLNCDVQTVFTSQLCIECDACVDICPMDCITFTRERRGGRSAHAAAGAGDQPHAGPLRRRRPQDRPRDGEGRGRLPALRALRRALPDRRVGHAEISHRHDPRGNTMPVPSPISSVNDFVVRFANVNGSGSASANELFARSILRMGVPVVAAQHLPVQHPGPADLVRGARHRGRPSRRPRRRRPDGRDEPADLGQGRRLDRARRLPVLRFDQADAGVEVPRRHHGDRRAADRHLQRDLHRSAPAPAVQEHHLSRRAVGAARHGRQGDREADRRAVQGQGEAAVLQRPRAASRPRLGADQPQVPDRAARAEGRQGRRPHLHRGQQRRGARRGLWRRHGLRLVSDHAVVLARRRLHQPLQAAARRPGDQEGEIRHRPGRGRARLDRHGDRRRLERRARLHRDLRPRHLADAGVHRACLFRRNSGGDLQRAARRPLDRHADPHPAVRPDLLRLCLARRHQARAAVPRGPGRRLRVGGAVLRSRRPAADHDLRDARSRHRHEPPALPPAEVGRQQAIRPRQGDDRRDARRRQRLRPLSRRRRRRHPVPHLSRHASDQGLVLHPRHLARPLRALHRGRRGLRRQHAAAAAQVRDRQGPGAAAAAGQRRRSRPNTA